MKTSRITENILLDMLGNTLVEMRAHSNPNYAKTMADVFHNVPARLVRKMPPLEIYEDMVRVAKRHSVEDYLISLLKHSSEKLEKENKSCEEE